MATTEAPKGRTETTKREPVKGRGNERRGSWKDTGTGKFVSRQKALDTLSA